MDISNEDFEEAAVEMLSTLSLNGDCILELMLVNESYLIYQESDEVPDRTLEVEPLKLANAVEAAPLASYIESHDYLLGEDPVYLVGARVGEERYQIHWAR